MVPLTEHFACFVSVPHGKVFDDGDLDRILAYKKILKAERGETFREHKGLRSSHVRWIRRDELPDAQWLFEKLRDAVATLNEAYFHAKLDAIEPLQLTEYKARGQQHYGAHVDCSYGMALTRRRKLSFTLQLSDPKTYKGGDLKLYWDGLTSEAAPRERGRFILFRSHVLHEVTPVTKGTRYSLVGWVNGDEWT